MLSCLLESVTNKIEWRMGCVNSRRDINDQHSNLFQVMNVDDLGNLITPGKLQVSSVDITLYQKNKPPVKWPLRCLRRYGYDAEIFSFESGRRCSTGPGIFAFKCCRAAQLFNLVQANIQQVCFNGDDTVSRDIQIPLHPVPAVSRIPAASEQNYLDPTPASSNGRFTQAVSACQQNGTSHLSTGGSSSVPLSPQGTLGSPSPPPVLPLALPPPPPIPNTLPISPYVNKEALQCVPTVPEMEHNNNDCFERTTVQRSHTSSISTTPVLGNLTFESLPSLIANVEIQAAKSKNWSTSSAVMQAAQSPSYMNVDLGIDALPLSPSQDNPEEAECEEECIESPPYMNISPGQDKPVLKPRPIALEIANSEADPHHNYANLEAGEVEHLKKRFSSASLIDESPISREMSYAVLDLDKNIEAIISDSHCTETATNLTPPASPLKVQQQSGYVTIDFDKTAALSHSVNASDVMDEGYRKTRHDSTIISDLVAPPSTRHNSSVSE